MEGTRKNRWQAAAVRKAVSVFFGLCVCLLLFSAAVFADAAEQHSTVEGARIEAVQPNAGYGVSSLARPSGLRIVCKGLNKLELYWNGVSGASYYYIYEKLPDASGYAYIGTIYGTSCDLYNNFRAGKRYYYRVKAVNSSGSSAYSNYVRCIPKEPTRKITRSLSGKNVKLSLRWVATAKSYQIARKIGSASYRGIRTSSSRTYTDTNTSRGKTYYYRYRAIYKYNGNKMYGAWSPSVKVTIPGGGTTPPSPGKTVYRALIVANGTYSNGNNLSGPGTDANNMNRLLKSRGYSKVTVKRNVPTKKAFTTAIRSAFSGAKSTDVSLFYYTGHGVADYTDSYEGALCPTNAYYADEMFTMRELASALSKVPGKVIVLLDSCGSGGGIYASSKNGGLDAEQFNAAAVNAFASANEYVPEADDEGVKTGELRKNKFYVLTACGYKETSIDFGKTNGGAFTYYLLYGGGFQAGSGAHFMSGSMPADSNRDNKYTLKEAHSYVRTRTSQYGQHARSYPANSSQVIMKK